MVGFGGYSDQVRITRLAVSVIANKYIIKYKKHDSSV